MRLRNVTGSREMLAESQFTVNEPLEYRGKWNVLFENNNPIHIEIGTGKGQFLIKMAQENPNVNYIGIEKYSSVLIRATDKLKDSDLKNIVFIRMDAENIEDVFSKNEVARIYLNFSDPWPKDRHAKRRLPSKEFLARYDKILQEQGHIEFKTDNTALFDFALEEAKEAHWKIIESTYDLHHSTMNQGNIMTEYEKKFSEMGNPIHKLIANR